MHNRKQTINLNESMQNGFHTVNMGASVMKGEGRQKMMKIIFFFFLWFNEQFRLLELELSLLPVWLNVTSKGNKRLKSNKWNWQRQRQWHQQYTTVYFIMNNCRPHTLCSPYINKVQFDLVFCSVHHTPNQISFVICTLHIAHWQNVEWKPKTEDSTFTICAIW